MDFRKIYHFRYMNTFQVIACTGAIMTAVAQFILHLIHKTIPDFELLYFCWLALYIFGLARNIFVKPQDHHH